MQCRSCTMTDSILMSTLAQYSYAVESIMKGFQTQGPGAKSSSGNAEPSQNSVINFRVIVILKLK